MGWIYVLEFPNGKNYVGQTRREKVEDRWRGHKQRALTSEKHCRALGAAIRKYGWDNVQKRVLEAVADNAKLDERECAWIAQLQSNVRGLGYNLTDGADKNPMLTGSVRERQKEVLAMPGMRERKQEAMRAHFAIPGNREKRAEQNRTTGQTATFKAKCSATNVEVWARPGHREKRGKSIRDALNTPEMVATRASRHEQMKATKALRYQEKLAALPPEEAERRRKNAERTARNRAIRAAKAHRIAVGLHTAARAVESDDDQPDWWS